MSSVRILSLLLAISSAINIAFAVSLLTRASGASTANAVLAGAGAAATAVGLYFAAVAAYH